MTHSSIGSGPEADSNENHPTGEVPSKTMGEQAQASGAPPRPAAPVPPEPAAPADEITEDALASPDEILKALPTDPANDNPGNFPDGPNVAPSPWEKDAAQGKG